MANLFDILNLGNQESDEDGSRDESRRTNATERIAEIHRSTEESNKFNDESANMADLQQSEDTEVVLQSSPTCSLTDDSVGENHEDHEPDHKYMPISPMKTFVIPRKKKENKDLLQSLSLDSREYARDILPMVSQHYRERSSKSTFTYQSAYLVHNADLNREFQEKRKEMKSEGRTDKELNEHYAFFCVDNIDQAKDICQLGLRINSSSVTCLGNSKMGVYVSRYSDLIQRNMLPAGLEAVLIIFKLMKGRVKAMTENHSWNIIEPTPNYDCHVSKSANLDITHLTAKQAFDSTQYYIYEFGELDMVERPRHLRPYAVLTFKYTPLHPNLIIPAGTPPRSRNAVTTPVIGSSPTSSVLVAKDPRILQAGQHEAMDENSYCLWSGHLTNKSKPLCKVKLVSYATPIKPVIFPSTINICKQISLDNLRKHLASKIFFKGLPINTGEKEAFIESKYYAYCEVKSSNDYRGRLWNFTKFLDSNRMAGVVNFGDVTEMILLPTCQFTVDLGITSHGYPMVLHGLFVSTKPTIKHIKFCGAHCSSSSRDDSIYMPSESIHNEAHPPRLFELRKAISIAMELQKQNFNRMSSKSLTGTFVPTHHAQYLQTPYQLENPGTKSWATPPKSKYSATESAQAPRPKNTTSSSESMLQSPQTNYPTVISPHVTHGYSTGSQSTAVKITSPTLQVNNSNNNNETNNASSPTASRSKAVKAEERSPQLQVSPLYVGSLLPDLDQLGSDDLNSLLQKLKPILGQTLQNDAPPPPEPPLPPNEGKAAKVLDKEVKVVVEKQSTVTKSNELPLKPVESTGSLDLKDLPDSPESPDSELVDHVKEPKQVLKGMEEVKSKSRVTETNIAKMDENKPIGSKLKSDDSVIMSNAALEGKAVLQSQTESGEQADIYKDDPIMDADEMKAFLEKSLIPPKIENIPSKVEIDNASDMKNYLNARFTRNLEKSSKKRKRQDSSQAMKVETEPGEKRRSVRVKLDDDNVRKFESRDVLTFTAVPGINLVGRIPKKCKLEKESSSSSEQVDKTSSTCSLRKEDPTTSIGRSEISGSSKHITKITDSSIKTDSIDISVDSYKAAKVEILKVEKKTELMDTSERLTDNKVEIDEKSVLEVLDMELDSTGEDSDEDITLSDASLILESDHEEEEESGGVAFTGHHVVVENDKQLKICRPCVSSVAPTAYAAELDTEARLLQCVSAALHNSTFDAEEPHSELVDTVLSVLHKGTAGSDCDSEDSTERHVVQNDWIIGDDDSNLTEVIDIAESVPSIQEKMTVSEDSEDVVVPLQIANKTEVEQTAINEVQPLVANDASFTGNVEATVKSGHLHNVSSTVKMIEDEVKSADCQTGCSQENKNENKMHSGDSSNVSSTAKKTEVEVKSGDCQTGSSTAKKTENKMHSGDSPNVSLTAKKTEVEVKSGDCQTGSSTAKKTENKMHSGDSPNLSSTAKKTEVEVKSGDCQTGSSTAKKNENKMHSGDSPNLSSTAKEKENMEQSGDSDTIISTSKNEENERTSNTNNDNSFGNKDVNLEQSAFLNNINISSILPNLRKSIDLILNEEKKNLEVEQNKSPTVSTSDVESSVKVEKDKQISRGNMKQGDRKSTKDVGVEPSRQSKRFHPYGKGKRTTEQEPSPGPVVTQELHTLMKNLTAKNYLATKSEKPIKLMNNFYDMPAGSSPARFRTCDVPSRLRRNTTSGSESSESTVKNEGDERVQKNDSRKVRSKDFISKLSLYDSIVNSRQEMDADDVYETEGKIYSNPSMAVQREQHAPAPSRQRLLMGGMSHTGRNIPTLQEGECKQTHIKDSSLPPVIKTPIGLVSTTGDHKVQTISLSCNNKPGIGQTTHSGQDIHSNLINSSSSSSSRCITNDSINNDSRCYITTSTITTTTTLAFNAHNHHTSGGAEDSNLSNLVFGCGDGKTVNESMMQDDFNCIPMDLDDECQDYNINSQEKKKHTFVKDKHSKLRSRINTSRDPRLQKRHPTMPEPDREAKENIVDLTETEGIKDILRSSRQLEAVSKRSRPLSLKSSSDIIQSVRQRARTEVENTDIESPNIKEAYRSLSNLCSRIKEEHKIGPVGGDCKEVVENSAGLVHQLSDVNTEERIRSWLDSMEPDHGEAHEEEKKDNQQTSGADVVPDLDDLTSATFEPAVTKKKKIRISFSQYKNKAKEAESVEIEEGTVKNKLPVSLTVHLKRKITHGIEGPEKIKCQVETSFGMAGKYGNGVHATAEVSPVLTNTDETVKCAATEPSSVQTSFGSNGECPFLEKRETSQSIEDAGEIMCTFQKTSKDESASEVPSSKKIESSFWTDFGSNIGEGSIFEKNQIPFLNISCTSGQKGVSPSLMESRIDPRKNDKSQTLLSDERGNAEEVMEILSDDRGNDEGVTEELKTEPQHLDNIFSFTKFDQGIENNKETNVTHKDMCPGSKTDSLLKAITFNIKDDVYALLKTVSGTFIKKDAAIRIPSDRTSEPDFDTEDCVLIENAPSGEKHKVDAASAFSPETDTSDWPITGKTKETFCAAFTEMKLVMFEALISHGEELCNLLDGGSVNLYFSDNLQLKPLSHDYGNNTWKDTSVCFTLEEAKHQFQEELDEAWDVVFERTSNYSTGNTGSEINILEHACEQYDESEQSQEENSQQYTNKNFEPVEIKSLSASTIKKEVISKPGSKIVISLSGAFPKEEVLEGKKGEAKIQEGFSIPVQHTRQMINTLPTMRKKKHECQLKPVPPSPVYLERHPLKYFAAGSLPSETSKAQLCPPLPSVPPPQPPPPPPPRQPPPPPPPPPPPETQSVGPGQSDYQYTNQVPPAGTFPPGCHPTFTGPQDVCTPPGITIQQNGSYYESYLQQMQTWNTSHLHMAYNYRPLGVSAFQCYDNQQNTESWMQFPTSSPSNTWYLGQPMVSQSDDQSSSWPESEPPPPGCSPVTLLPPPSLSNHQPELSVPSSKSASKCQPLHATPNQECELPLPTPDLITSENQELLLPTPSQTSSLKSQSSCSAPSTVQFTGSEAQEEVAEEGNSLNLVSETEPNLAELFPVTGDVDERVFDTCISKENEEKRSLSPLSKAIADFIATEKKLSSKRETEKFNSENEQTTTRETFPRSSRVTRCDSSLDESGDEEPRYRSLHADYGSPAFNKSASDRISPSRRQLQRSSRDRDSPSRHSVPGSVGDGQKSNKYDDNSYGRRESKVWNALLKHRRLQTLKSKHLPELNFACHPDRVLRSPTVEKLSTMESSAIRRYHEKNKEVLHQNGLELLDTASGIGNNSNDNIESEFSEGKVIEYVYAKQKIGEVIQETKIKRIMPLSIKIKKKPMPGDRHVEDVVGAMVDKTSSTLNHLIEKPKRTLDINKHDHHQHLPRFGDGNVELPGHLLKTISRNTEKLNQRMDILVNQYL